MVELWPTCSLLLSSIDEFGDAKLVKWLHEFGEPSPPISRRDARHLSLKGVRLAEISSLGVHVPPGFTITTDVCTYFYENGKRYPKELAAEVEASLACCGKLTGKAFGDNENPLLVSVRSGASMPGMMDTVLNLGLNDITVEALATRSGDARFAYDSYRRFIQMYASVVLGLAHHTFDEILECFKENKGVTLDTELTAEDWKKLVAEFKRAVTKNLSTPFPQDPREQLWGAIGAVFDSWMNPRAVNYRRLHDIPENLGTAVTIQAMVFGNMGETSATGVAFTRNPSTGAKELYGEFLLNAQGEDVVAGLRTPQHLTETARIAAAAQEPSLERTLPECFHEFVRIVDLLERHYRDMQDIEFTIEQGRLYILGSRDGKPTTAKAEMRIAVDLANEGLITKEEAVMRVSPSAFRQILMPVIDPGFSGDVIAKGQPASRGVASGRIVLSSAEAVRLAARGDPVILVIVQATPEDLPGMHAARAIVATQGGDTSHAAVYARDIGRPCVTGADAILPKLWNQTLSVGNRTFLAGDTITVDGSLGRVLAGAAPTIEPRNSGELASLLTWADDIASEVGAIIHDSESARRASARGHRKIIVSAVECLLRHPDGTQILHEIAMAADSAAFHHSLDSASTLIRNSIVAIVDTAIAEDVCVIIGEEIPCELRAGLPSASLCARGSYAINPAFVLAQHAAIYAAIDQLASTGRVSTFTVAIANVFHESDVRLVRKWAHNLMLRPDNVLTPQVAVAGLLDSPHSVLFRNRIFRDVEKLFIDLPALALRLFLLSKEAIETYQDLGHLDLGLEAGGGFNDVIEFLDRCFRPDSDDAGSIQVHALLTGPCTPEAMQVLLKCGVTQVALPGALLPGAVISVAHSFAGV